LGVVVLTSAAVIGFTPHEERLIGVVTAKLTDDHDFV